MVDRARLATGDTEVDKPRVTVMNQNRLGAGEYVARVGYSLPARTVTYGGKPFTWAFAAWSRVG